MIIFFLKKLRKLFKSIGKLENTTIDKLVLLEKKNLSAKSYIINNKNFTNFKYNLSKKNYPKKIAIVIFFYFNKNKINILKKTVKSITTFPFNFELTLLTNQLSKKQKNILLKVIRSKKRTIKIYEATKLPDNNLLPWYSINVMKERLRINLFHILCLLRMIL